MSDFHRASLKMALRCLYRITNESTKIENCYSSLNRKLRLLWNSVYEIRLHRMDSKEMIYNFMTNTYCVVGLIISSVLVT